MLYETRSDRYMSSVVVVSVPHAVQERRLMARDGLSAEQAGARIDAQMPLEEKMRRADVVIDNNGLLEDTRGQVLALLARLHWQHKDR